MFFSHVGHFLPTMLPECHSCAKGGAGHFCKVSQKSGLLSKDCCDKSLGITVSSENYLERCTCFLYARPVLRAVFEGFILDKSMSGFWVYWERLFFFFFKSMWESFGYWDFTQKILWEKFWILSSVKLRRWGERKLDHAGGHILLLLPLVVSLECIFNLLIFFLSDMWLLLFINLIPGSS